MKVLKVKRDLTLSASTKHWENNRRVIFKLASNLIMDVMSELN